MDHDEDSRSAVSVGMAWGTRVTAVALEFAVPGALGYALDLWLGTSPGFTLGGAILGLAMGMYHVLQLPAEMARAQQNRRSPTMDGGPEQDKHRP
ncbi:AtpZ/AtpI family protein [Paludisphaera rhizosphaerae]|uniref:AtpZ/AtpI family protein n=1 Tax=Paludisphaera rhizosphaerae TaxID=2711216 RepID=UPI0013EAA922|nr:AtpZ/AtpI family protein [Paludisphaera rhizosphaerae]